MEIPYDVKVLECGTAFIWKGEDGNVYVKCKLNSFITLETQKKLYVNIKNAAGNTPCGLIVSLVGITNMTKESRDYSGSEEHVGFISATALLISNPLTQILGNFFMGLNKPVFPTKLFRDLDAAKLWLQDPAITYKPK